VFCSVWLTISAPLYVVLTYAVSPHLVDKSTRWLSSFHIKVVLEFLNFCDKSVWFSSTGAIALHFLQCIDTFGWVRRRAFGWGEPAVPGSRGQIKWRRKVTRVALLYQSCLLVCVGANEYCFTPIYISYCKCFIHFIRRHCYLPH